MLLKHREFGWKIKPLETSRSFITILTWSPHKLMLKTNFNSFLWSRVALLVTVATRFEPKPRKSNTCCVWITSSISAYISDDVTTDRWWSVSTVSNTSSVLRVAGRSWSTSFTLVAMEISVVRTTYAACCLWVVKVTRWTGQATIVNDVTMVTTQATTISNSTNHIRRFDVIDTSDIEWMLLIKWWRHYRRIYQNLTLFWKIQEKAPSIALVVTS